jgi:hypothetical protein
MIAACGHPSSQLGSFSERDWAKDCETAIVEENPRDPAAPGPILRDGGPAFQRATKRYRCAPPGWAVYADDGGRILGLCVDDDTRRRGQTGSFHDTVDHEVDRARRIIAEHWGPKLAGEMLRGADDDHCSPSSTQVSRGIVRWGATQLTYPESAEVHSLYMCCWEVED